MHKRKEEGKSVKLTLAAALATLVFVGPAIAADSAAGEQNSPSQNPHVNTGLQTRNPATNAAGVNGLPGNKSGKATRDSGSSGASAGASGVNTGVETRNPDTNAAKVNGLPGNKSGKAIQNPGNSAGSAQK
jgi:hypothetical protein